MEAGGCAANLLAGQEASWRRQWWKKQQARGDERIHTHPIVPPWRRCTAEGSLQSSLTAACGLRVMSERSRDARIVKGRACVHQLGVPMAVGNTDWHGPVEAAGKSGVMREHTHPIAPPIMAVCD